MSETTKMEYYADAVREISKLTAENAELKAQLDGLTNPVTVWTNMLRGTIAIPSHLVETHDYQQIKSENAELEAQLKGWEANATYSINMGVALATEKLQKERDELKAKLERQSRFSDDLEMAFDDDFGWMHKDSLATVNELKAKLEQAQSILRDYRNQPNCGEYGVTKGWIYRVDEALGK